MKNYLSYLSYKFLDYMQNYILKKGDKILIESSSQKHYFKNFKNISELKNPLNRKRISSIKFRKNRNSDVRNGIYFGNYGYQHQNKNFERFLDLSKKHNIFCKYFGPNNIGLNFSSKQNSIKFHESSGVFKDISFQLVSVNDLVETNPLPYKMIELAALGIPPIFFASQKHYFHNEIKKFNMGLSVSTLEELMDLFTKDKHIYNCDFNLLGSNVKEYMFKNHSFNKNDRKLFE